jgi:hypothetical protein
MGEPRTEYQELKKQLKEAENAAVISKLYSLLPANVIHQEISELAADIERLAKQPNRNASQNSLLCRYLIAERNLSGIWIASCLKNSRPRPRIKLPGK